MPFDTWADPGQLAAMWHLATHAADSAQDWGIDGLPLVGGGAIPGLPGAPAYGVLAPGPSPIPVVIAAPHGGRLYPPSVLAALREPALAGQRLEDRLVDRIAAEVAMATGAHLILARAPRAMIDLNRATSDIDWTMLRGAPDSPCMPDSLRVRSGLGLVPRRLPVTGELWRGPLDFAELEARIAGVHAPYHAALGGLLARQRERWGAALLIDLHSMPSLPLERGKKGAEIVLGDRFGSACSGALVAQAFALLGSSGRRVAHNRPYAGGYDLERHAAPGRGYHGVQIEIDRAADLDADLVGPGAGYGAIVALLVALVRHLAEPVAALGRPRAPGGDLAEAAE